MNPTVEEIVQAIQHSKIRCFGGGNQDTTNPIRSAFSDRPIMFALGVDVREVVEFVLNMIKSVSADIGTPRRGGTDAQGKTIIDPDKAATTTALGHRVRNVKLSSRYDQQHEYDAMIKVIRSLSPALVRKLKSMWCDSKATATYTIEGEHLSQDDIYTIGIAFVEKCGGHNGIWGPDNLYAAPDWGVT